MKKFILGCILSVFYCAMVNAAPVYEADVSVDVTAKNVAEAKEKAMAKARRDGVNEVALSVSTKKSLEILNKLNDNQLQHFVNGVMVLMEKTSDVRYIADLRISVNEEILKAYLQENDLPLIASAEQEVLVIPLLENSDGTIDLWSEDNIWRQAFVGRCNFQKGNLNIRCIEKNLGNITVVDASKMFDMNEQEYNELIAFNRVDILYVFKYSLKDNKVYAKSFPEMEVADILIDGQSPDAMINQALALIKGNDKERDIEENEYIEESYDVVYTYPRLGEWTRLKRLLDENPQVDKVTIVSIANSKVHFNFVFSGVFDKLRAYLDVNGYKLRNEGDFYAIY